MSPSTTLHAFLNVATLGRHSAKLALKRKARSAACLRLAMGHIFHLQETEMPHRAIEILQGPSDDADDVNVPALIITSASCELPVLQAAAPPAASPKPKYDTVHLSPLVPVATPERKRRRRAATLSHDIVNTTYFRPTHRRNAHVAGRMDRHALSRKYAPPLDAAAMALLKRHRMLAIEEAKDRMANCI